MTHIFDEQITNVVATTSVANSTATGTIDAAAETVECVVSPGASTVGCQLTGTWAAAGDLVIFEATVDGTNWASIYANLTSLGSLAVIISGSNGLYQMAVAGYVKVRVRGHTWGAPGTCSVSFNSSVGASASLLALPLPTGSNVIGGVTSDLTKIGGVAVGVDNGLYIRPGTGVSFGASPFATWVSGALTLTLATTAYLIPASEQVSRKILMLYNGSDTDMYVGSSAVTTSTGILIATGATMTLDAGSGLYAICGSAGKILRYLEGK